MSESRPFGESVLTTIARRQLFASIGARVPIAGSLTFGEPVRDPGALEVLPKGCYLTAGPSGRPEWRWHQGRA